MINLDQIINIYKVTDDMPIHGQGRRPGITGDVMMLKIVSLRNKKMTFSEIGVEVNRATSTVRNAYLRYLRTATDSYNGQ